MVDEETKPDDDQDGGEEVMREEEGATPPPPAHEMLEEEEIEIESVLTEYDPDDFVSGAVNSLDSTIPLDLFEFEHSYGYNCHKYFNLCACDDTVVCWAAGSIIVFMDVNTKQTWFRRSTTGGTVGNICSFRVDPNYRIAVAECREGPKDPVIILYTWPQMEIDAVLKDGTTNAYSILDFSPDGDLLASVGKEPDYNLTIWKWKRHKILLRTSAFTFDVNAVFFSPYCPGQLTTAGAAHIKFWKMAETFTGLKLKGELGRFGKTEICDVLGVYPMPDEKVLSGCEWGNVLVWEAGLVKIEVTQRGRKRCHDAPIIQFMLSPAGDEVTTIARDGCIRAWYWDTVEQADPPEDDPYVELNPVAETCVPGCQIMCLKHQKDMFWYAQDGNGGVWTVELEIDKEQCEHRKVMTCHAGGIVGMAALRHHPLLITAGEDGALQAYSTENQLLLVRYQFPAPITCMLYPPVDIDQSSCIIILGFADGIMRILLLHPERLELRKSFVDIRVHSALTIHSDDSTNADIIDTISLLKPHCKPIHQISMNEQRTLLVTCGLDKTIFMYKLELKTPFILHRLGFIETPNNVVYMTWKPEKEHVLLLCCQSGLLLEVVLPEVPVRKYEDITTFKLNFVSYTETLVKKNHIQHHPFPQEEDLASIDEEALKAQTEAENEMDTGEEEEPWIGEVELIETEDATATTLTWAEYCDEGIWVVQHGTGALLLVKPGSSKILKFAPLPNAWSDDITTLRFICERQYLAIGTNNGYIRVVKMPTVDEDNPDYHYMKWMDATFKLLKKLKGRRLAKEEPQPIPRIDFNDNYYLPMHDSYTGAITGMEFTADGKQMFTCGRDGNIFSYAINFFEPLVQLPEEITPTIPKVEKVKEPSTLEGELMSHEQLKQKEEYDKMMAIANAHKKRVREQLAELTIEYNKLIKFNRTLPASQQIDVTLDPRPLEVQEEELNAAKALTRRKLAHQLEASDIALNKMFSRNIIQLDVYPFTLTAIRDPNVVIRPLRQKNLSKAFTEQLEEVHAKMAEAALRGRRTESMARRQTARRPSWGPPRVASFLLGLPPDPPHELKKALRNYYIRLNRHHLQFIEWQDHLSKKPDPNAMPPGAAEALKEAESSIGNKLLKTQPEYVAPPGHNTQLRICLMRQEIYTNKRAFNEKVLQLREHKLKLVEQMRQIGERLAEIRCEIPPKMVKQPPAVPVIDEDLEFPEKNLEVKPEPIVTTSKGGHVTKKSQEREKKSHLFPQMRVRAPRVPPFVPIMESRPKFATWELLKHRPDADSSPIEIEIRERRIDRHLYEQDMLLADADVSIQQFDSRVRQLQRERIRVQENNQLLELQLYQMHREMNVLNRFEAHEDRLAERVYSKLMQVKAIQEQILDCEHRIEDHKIEKEQLILACQEMQRQFKKLVQDNQFADFLRRIFKKKYRPPREHDDDESESSSESSSSSEEDEGSLDSRDIGPIQLDPTICPEGCEREIYDATYEMRNKRHKFEQDMIEQDHLVDLLRKDIEAHNKVKRKLSMQLDTRKNNLREFMLEKQSNLNEVNATVVLRYDQIKAKALQEMLGAGGFANVVVFPEAELHKLRRRVTELQDEIKQQRIRHKINRTHLHRMNIDLRAMEASAEELRAQMRDVLTKKLGKPRKVDKTLDDLLRQMARRHKYSANMGFMPQIMSQVADWKKRYNDLEKSHFKALEKYSERLRLAAALQADIFPTKVLKQPAKMPGDYTPEQYKRDVVRLRIVRAQQEQQIEMLQKEIQAMKLKPMPPEEKRATWSRESSYQSQLEVMTLQRRYYRPKKYFPLTPLASATTLVYDANIMNLLHNCLDAMRVTRDDANVLLTDVTAQLPAIISGDMSRYEVIDKIVQKWLLKYGGDPSMYKNKTKAFDALAVLVAKLIQEHLKASEVADHDTHQIMEQLETALRDVSDCTQPLQDRLAPAIAALLHSAPLAELETRETMASLVSSLLDEARPLTAEIIDKIDVNSVVDDIINCGVNVPKVDLQRIVMLTIGSLQAQLVSPEEAKQIDDEVTQALDQRSEKSNASQCSFKTQSHRSGRSVKSVRTEP